MSKALVDTSLDSSTSSGNLSARTQVDVDTEDAEVVASAAPAQIAGCAQVRYELK